MGVDIDTYRGRIGTFKFAYGNDVVTIVCVINLSGGIKVIGSVLFIGLLLLISGIESNPGPRENDADQEQRTILVAGIPDGVDKEHLLLVFKNARKHGGGKISNIRFNEEERSAFIQFEQSATVQSVLQKRPIVLSGKVVEIDVVTADASFQSVLCTSSTVEVSGFQVDESAKELLEYYFEDEDSSVAQRVVDKGTHALRQKPLTVVPYITDDSPQYDRFNDSSTLSMEITAGIVQRKDTGTMKAKKFDVHMEDINVELKDSHDQATGMEQPERDEEIKGDAVHTLNQILERTALTDKYPGGISIQDIISIDLEENSRQQYTYEGLPWVLLRRIIGVHSKARDLSIASVVTENSEQAEHVENDVNVFDLLQVEDTSPDSNVLSPFDIFLITIQCCDPMLKQLLFKKLYLCKIALPFVQYDRLSSKWEIVVWPFRSLVVESKILSQSLEHRTIEIEILELPVKTVTFAKFGKPLYSKSKLMNDLLSDDIQDTFFQYELLTRYVTKMY
ncbi:uncharacterized protein LOC123531378 isoform X2 [Mercenaria mercenaria]|uniref:uncharacterized protein LOC123531378 isoform X2 n=1 Tax=Mercenaria mercenaria TaxID=6596 RepID=UPI00234FA8AE|nr:uncharacterized protein LOC123531378 isoform X2 [Mercenaria mercenaria]